MIGGWSMVARETRWKPVRITNIVSVGQLVNSVVKILEILIDLIDWYVLNIIFA